MQLPVPVPVLVPMLFLLQENEAEEEVEKAKNGRIFLIKNIGYCQLSPAPFTIFLSLHPLCSHLFAPCAAKQVSTRP